MKVLVCGGRNYADREAVYAMLDHYAANALVIIHGGARGADALAHEWAVERQKLTLSYPADWDAHGRSAGPIRNKLMIQQKPDLVVAFPGGPGTEDMVRRAQAARVPIVMVLGPHTARLREPVPLARPNPPWPATSPDEPAGAPVRVSPPTAGGGTPPSPHGATSGPKP